MKIRYLYLALEGDDYDIESPKLTGDFDFQTGFIFNYFERILKKEKFEADKFHFITIRGRKEPSKQIILKEHFKSLELEISFDEKRYKKLYPFENDYPLEDRLLKPILKEEEFCHFLFEMIMQGLEKAKEQKAPIPYDFLINTTLDFKANGFKNEWVHKTRTFKENGVKANLFCRLTVNYFSLELIIEKNKQEIFRKEILRTLPSSMVYRYKFKDIQIEKDRLLVTKDMYDEPPLFEINLSQL